MATHIKIATITVGTAQASLDFTSIPATYTDLKLVLSTRSTNNDGSPWTGLALTFNGSSSSFTGIRMYGTGSASASDTATPRAGSVTGNTATASTFGTGELYIPNYAGSNYKTVSISTATENNATAALMMLNAVLWSNTAAINQITLTCGIGNFDTYSSATLYGIKSS
jgi:hypothetical protein